MLNIEQEMLNAEVVSAYFNTQYSLLDIQYSYSFACDGFKNSRTATSSALFESGEVIVDSLV